MIEMKLYEYFVIMSIPIISAIIVGAFIKLSEKWAGAVASPVKEEKTEERSSKKVLIVIDMQNDFLNGPLSNEETKNVVPDVVEEIKRARENEYEVIFTFDTHGRDYLETLEGKNLPIPHCIEESEGWLLDERISDLLSPEDTCVLKRTFGSVCWDEYLDKDIEEVEMVGVCTDICVVSNALIIKSVRPEANIKVKSDCCAGTSKETHEAALKTMSSCQIEII